MSDTRLLSLVSQSTSRLCDGCDQPSTLLLHIGTPLRPGQARGRACLCVECLQAAVDLVNHATADAELALANQGWRSPVVDDGEKKRSAGLGNPYSDE